MAKPKIQKPRKAPSKPVTKPKIKKTTEAVTKAFAKPFVFYDCHRRVHLLLTEGEKFNRYITTRDEEMRVVKLDHGEPARDDKGQIKHQDNATSANSWCAKIATDNRTI